MAQVHTIDEPNDYHLIEDNTSLNEYAMFNDHEVNKLNTMIDEDIEATLQYHAYIKNELEKNFPVKYVIVHSVLMIILNICLIFLQIIAIKFNAALSDLGLGFWVGVYNLITAVLALLTSILKN
jgi:hypothetical protein